MREAPAFGSATFFALVRDGQFDTTVLGGLQADRLGRLVIWMIPGRLIPGLSGAMKLSGGARPVIAVMSHAETTVPNIVPDSTLPATSLRPATLIVREMAVIELSPNGLIFRERAPGVSIDAVRRATDAELQIAGDVSEMEM